CSGQAPDAGTRAGNVKATSGAAIRKSYASWGGRDGDRVDAYTSVAETNLGRLQPRWRPKLSASMYTAGSSFGPPTGGCSRICGTGASDRGICKLATSSPSLICGGPP